MYSGWRYCVLLEITWKYCIKNSRLQTTNFEIYKFDKLCHFYMPLSLKAFFCSVLSTLEVDLNLNLCLWAIAEEWTQQVYRQKKHIQQQPEPDVDWRTKQTATPSSSSQYSFWICYVFVVRSFEKKYWLSFCLFFELTTKTTTSTTLTEPILEDQLSFFTNKFHLLVQ